MCYKPDMVPAHPYPVPACVRTRSTKVPNLLCHLPVSPNLTCFSGSRVRSKTQGHPPLSGPCPPCPQLPTPLFSGVSSSWSEWPDSCPSSPAEPRQEESSGSFSGKFMFLIEEAPSQCMFLWPQSFLVLLCLVFYKIGHCLSFHMDLVMVNCMCQLS